MTRAAVRARGPLTRVTVVRSCCANISVHCVQVSPYALCMFAHEVLMPFEVKLKCSIPRDFLPPHRINIGSLSCRADAEGSMNMNPHAISSIVPRRRGYNIYRRSEGTIQSILSRHGAHDISCASYNSANRTTKSRNLATKTIRVMMTH